MSDLLHLKKHW